MCDTTTFFSFPADRQNNEVNVITWTNEVEMPTRWSHDLAHLDCRPIYSSAYLSLHRNMTQKPDYVYFYQPVLYSQFIFHPRRQGVIKIHPQFVAAPPGEYSKA